MYSMLIFQGVASLLKGSLEFIIDRRASRDDGRGLEEAVMDMIPMTHKYRILFERRCETNETFISVHIEQFHSSYGMVILQHVLEN